MDIELDEISNFLKTQKIGKSGIELIINHKSEIVAYPELSSLIREENGVLRPVRVEELGVEPLSAAYREHVSTGKSRSWWKRRQNLARIIHRISRAFPQEMENRQWWFPKTILWAGPSRR